MKVNLTAVALMGAMTIASGAAHSGAAHAQDTTGAGSSTQGQMVPQTSQPPGQMGSQSQAMGGMAPPQMGTGMGMGPGIGMGGMMGPGMMGQMGMGPGMGRGMGPSMGPGMGQGRGPGMGMGMHGMGPGMGMAMGMGRGMGMGPGMMAGDMQRAEMIAPMIEARLAFARTAIGITDAQAQAWNELATAVRSRVGDIRSMMQDMQTMHTGPVPQQLDMHIKHMSAMLDALKAIKGPVDKLYASLSDEQRRRADMLAGPGPMI